MSPKLSNTPVKGTRDWEPQELAIRHYIFETWRRINRQFGYQEYLTPILESADIYRAKSGIDVGGKELLVIKDQAGRELAIRPEMTPSVTRMVSKFYKQTPKPVRLFSIANFWRNEKPQRGRNREFWQLNTDIFGSESLNADIEILQLILSAMLAFNPPQGAFTLYLNHRQLIDGFLDEIAAIPENKRLPTVRLLDKFTKLPPTVFEQALKEIGHDQVTIKQLRQFMEADNAECSIKQFPQLKTNPGYQAIYTILKTLQTLGFEDWVVFDPSIIRGFDYYDGLVFEVFDNQPQNNRSMFGGGRYNGLGNLFGNAPIPAVGVAPGDETTRLFLEDWDLIPAAITGSQTIYLPLLQAEALERSYAIAAEMRDAGFNVEQGLEQQTLKQALTYANKRHYPYVVILGADELAENRVALKTMITGQQEVVAQSNLVGCLQSL